jgi:hypothetical protein
MAQLNLLKFNELRNLISPDFYISQKCLLKNCYLVI